MNRSVFVIALLVSTAASADNAFTSTPFEAHNREEARNICNMKSNLFVQAYDDRNREIEMDVEIRRLRAAMRNTRLEPTDIDDLVRMAYSLNQPIWQVQPALVQACMAPFLSRPDASSSQ
jgi:hypothetical protein